MCADEIYKSISFRYCKKCIPVCHYCKQKTKSLVKCLGCQKKYCDDCFDKYFLIHSQNYPKNQIDDYQSGGMYDSLVHSTVRQCYWSGIYYDYDDETIRPLDACENYILGKQKVNCIYV